MADFLPELPPKYGQDPRTGEDDPYPSDGSDEMRLIRHWCNAAYEEAKTDMDKSEELKFVEKYQDYLEGRQWASGRPSYRAKPVDNRMYRMFWELVGTLSNMEPLIHVKATERDQVYMKQEEVINRALKAWWYNTDADMAVGNAIAWATLTTAYAKWQWNPELNMGMGDLEMKVLGPRQVLLLKPELDLQSSQAVIMETFEPVGLAKRRYSRRAHLIVPDPDISQYEVESGPPRNVTPQIWSIMQPGLKKMLGGGTTVNPSSYPMVRMREFWIKDYSVNTSNQRLWMGKKGAWWREGYFVNPGERIYPRGRIVVMAGKNIVHDGPNPYWHGRFPFGMLRLNVVPWRLYGMSDLRSWMDLQDIINQILAGLIDLIKKAVNPGFYAPSNALSDNTWQNMDWSMPGARLQYKASSPHEPKFAPTPPIPGPAINVLQMIFREFDMQSGIASLSEMVKRKQIPSGDTMDQFRQTQQTPIRPKGRNIEIFLRDGGQLQIPNLFQFYDSKRRLFLLGSHGQTMEDVDWDPGTMIPAGSDPAEHVRRFKFWIEPDSLLSIKRTQDAMEAMALRARQEISRKTLFKALGLRLDAEAEEKELMREHQMGLAALPPKATNKKGLAGSMGKR